MWERKYGDFFSPKTAKFRTPIIKSWYLGIFVISLFYKNKTQYSIFEKIKKIKY